MSRSDQNADINADLLDGLTGVANRSGWLQAAESVLSKDTEPKIVLYIDLDRFKFVPPQQNLWVIGGVGRFQSA